jgi:hypothetical protein
MEYDMKTRFIILIFIVQLAVCSAGCLSPAPVTLSQQALLPETTPTPESTRATIPPGDMALQLSDMPPDYLLKDRTIIAYSEVSQLAHDLGWQQGYTVMFTRANLEKNDSTGIHQSISVYPPENMNKVYALETERIISSRSGITRIEIPFPTIGDQSIALRETQSMDSRNFAVYTVIFKKKNVFEIITMEGTTTDYETLKDVVRKAADKIQ